MTVDKIRFTCENCKGTDFTEADGLMMEPGFVCTPCLYATSEEVQGEYITNVIHPLEGVYPEGLTHWQAHNLQALKNAGIAIAEHNRAWLESVTIHEDKRVCVMRKWFFVALAVLASVILFVSFAPPANAITAPTEVVHGLCLDGTWTHSPEVDGFVCVKDDGVYYPPEG